MAEKKSTPQTQALSKEYIIPLRSSYLKVPRYKRAGRAIKTIKNFVAKHMKVPDRDTTKIKLDTYLNSEVHFRGRKKPPAKLKVKVTKDTESENIIVNLSEAPQHVKFLKIRHSKLHKEVEKKEAPKQETPTTPESSATQAIAPTSHTPTKEQTPQEKKEEKEKAQSTAQERTKLAEQAATAEKHLAKGKGPQVQRKALKK
jgi:large subunit ribosomal protein L31e